MRVNKRNYYSTNTKTNKYNRAKPNNSNFLRYISNSCDDLFKGREVECINKEQLETMQYVFGDLNVVKYDYGVFVSSNSKTLIMGKMEARRKAKELL